MIIKTKSNFWDYTLACAGMYTADNLSAQLHSPVFQSIHRLIQWMCVENVPDTACNVRTNLEPRERNNTGEFERPATLFELAWFAQRFPEFPFLYGPIETYHDHYLTSYIKRTKRDIGVAIVRYDDEFDGLEITLAPWDKPRDSKFILVASYVA